MKLLYHYIFVISFQSRRYKLLRRHYSWILFLCSTSQFDHNVVSNAFCDSAPNYQSCVSSLKIGSRFKNTNMIHTEITFICYLALQLICSFAYTLAYHNDNLTISKMHHADEEDRYFYANSSRRSLANNNHAFPPGSYPNVFLIGSMKCGTTTLVSFRYLLLCEHYF